MSPETSPLAEEPEKNARQERLARFVGDLQEHDGETIAFWRQASSAEHAEAMIELSNYASDMATQTGLGKNPNDRFPGFPQPVTSRNREGE